MMKCGVATFGWNTGRWDDGAFTRGLKANPRIFSASTKFGQMLGPKPPMSRYRPRGWSTVTLVIHEMNGGEWVV